MFSSFNIWKRGIHVSKLCSEHDGTLDVDNQLHTGKAFLRRLKGLNKALRSLLNHSEYSIYKIQKALRPLVLHEGLNMIPNDVLAMIFEKDFESNPGYTPRLACVNRRFRDVALSLPKLWSALPLGRGKEKLDVYLTRSKDVGLTVRVGLGMTSIWDVQEVQQHAQRWECVYVEISNEDDKAVAPKSLSFPRLQSLTVQFIPSRTEYWGGFIEFNIDWKLPALRHLTFRSATPIIPPSVAANLITLDLRLNSPTELRRYDNAELLRQLSAMHNLQALSLSLHNAHNHSEETPSVQCDLRSLRDLSIEISGEAKILDIRRLLHHMNLVSVRKLSIKIDDEPERRSSFYQYQSLSSLFTTSSPHHLLTFPNTEHITVIISPKRNFGIRNRTLTLDDLLGHSAMRNLHINAPNLQFKTPEEFENRELNIRVVSIEGCSFGARKFLDHLLAHVNPDGMRLCSSIEKLRVLGCPEVTMNYLLDFLPEEKIDWSPVVGSHSSQRFRL